MSHQSHVTEYWILSEIEPVFLSDKVQDALGNGWQPFGPLSVSTVASETGMPIVTYAQAMVKQAEWFR